MAHAEGVGNVVVASYGAIDMISLGAGETVVGGHQPHAGLPRHREL